MVTLPRLIAAFIVVGVVVTIATIDLVASGIAVVGIVALVLVLARRSPSRARIGTMSVIVGATACAVASALALPVYANRPAPLVVTQAKPHPARAHPVDTSQQAGGSNFEVAGFVASDYDDSGQGVDRDAPLVTTLAATGIVLARHPGSIEVNPAIDTLTRAHLNGAAGWAVVSNFDGRDFNGVRAESMLSSREARRRFITAITKEVAGRGWDGVVLDLEQLPPQARGDYPKLIHGMERALGSRRVVVAVPAITDPTTEDAQAYDLQAIGQAADRVVVMAYDQHDITGAPGPVGGLPWVRQVLGVMTQQIPPGKLMLGVAGYGYAWKSGTGGRELTDADARALAGSPGAVQRWDAEQGEWYVRTPDGTEAWYADATSIRARTQMALDAHLAGIALWRVGSEDADALANLPVAPLKYPPAPASRPVQAVAANGVVALTFDDGPDPKWTPKVLAILRRHHATATFFMIGTQAQQHQQLVRQVLQDGNVIANHTYSHQDLSKMPGWRANLEILGGSAVIEGITGQKPLLFRSPYGAGDMTGTRVGGDQLAENLGMRSENWNDDPEDWTRPGADLIVQRALDQATERTVILLHDGGGNRSQTIAALPGIIEGLRARGYVFTTLDALDGSVVSPYGVRHGLAANARGIAVIAGFRLEMAGRHLILWLLVGAAALALLRLVVTVPLAVLHALRRRRRPLHASPAHPLGVSVIIPAHNEGAVLEKTLRAVAQLEGGPYEVIVVDDGSTDDTAVVAGRYPVTLLTQSQQGKAAALNHGVAVATGEVVVVLDADTVLDRSFVSRVLPHFTDPHVAAVAGNVRVGNRSNFLARLQSLEYVASLNLDRRAQAALNVVSVVPGAAGAFRRTALADVGGYPDDTLVEDADLTVALLAAGWRIPYEPAAIAWTEAPQSVRDVIRQRQRWSYGTVEVVAKHAPRMMDPASGRVGLLAIPWLLLTQVLLPLTGPLTDAFLLYLLVLGQWGPAAAILGIAVACDVVIVGTTLLIDGQHRSDIAYVPLMRLVWRPLQLAALLSSLFRWSHGRAQGWRKVKRHNTVVLPPAAETFA